MSRTSKQIEGQLALARSAISNMLAEPDLYAALAPYGYDTARLRQASQLCENARACNQQQKGAYGELSAASKALELARQQFNENYMSHIEVARVAFRSDLAVRKKLDLGAERKQANAKWFEQARQFYDNALSDPTILRTLIVFGTTQETLEATQRQLETVAAAEAARLRWKGAARDATMKRDQAIAELNTWLRDFLRLARVACKRKPQLLDKLGLAPRARDRVGRTSTTPPALVPTPTAILSAAEEPPPATERRNGRTATANREA